MSELTPLFAVLVMLAATLAMVSVWAPRRIEIKVGAVVVAFALMATTYAAMLDLLSRPKPTSFEWWTRRAAEATVVGSSFDESRAIYVWLQLDGVREPRAYALPWDQRVAEQLQAAARTAAERQSAVRMRLPFETTLDDREPRFYALPQPAMPPEDAVRAPAQVVSPPGTNARAGLTASPNGRTAAARPSLAQTPIATTPVAWKGPPARPRWPPGP